LEENFKTKLALLRSFWAKQGIDLNTGIPKLDIDKFQTEFNFEFEDNFLAYITGINGFRDYSSDEAWFCFWSLDRMKIENTDNSHPKDLVWFADHSINLCSFGFDKNDRKIYTHFDRSSEIIFIANNFNDFIELYLENPYHLIM
jgi:hypothetical protein